MARKGIVPPGFKRGGRGKAPIPPAPPGKGKNGKNGKTVVAKGAPLPSPPPRRRVTPGMPPPMQPPVMRGPVIAVHMPSGEAPEGDMGAMGPATRAEVAGDPRRRALAQAMRGGRMAF